MPDERGDVRRNFLGFDVPEKFPNVQRRRAAVPDDECRHSHAQEIFRERHIRDFVRVGVDVNESRRDDESGGVQFLFRLPRDFTDLGDETVLDRDVADEFGFARTVHDPPVPDDDIESLRRAAT